MAHAAQLPRAARPGFTEHAFKTRHGVELSVRVWPANPPVSEPAPFVTWTHGGGWLAGNNFAPLAWMHPGFCQRGYHLVSHTYRLGPQANVDDQLADCLEAIAWCRENLPNILGKDKVDIHRYVICGESAGGHLTTLMAHYLDPPPRAVIDAYGITDMLGAWPVLGELPVQDTAPPWDGEFSEEELNAFLSDRDPAKQLTQALSWDENVQFSEEDVAKVWLTDFKFTPRIRLQGELHRWRADLPARMTAGVNSMRKGVFHEERFQDENALKDYIISISPLYLLDGKTWYPPTAFLHGTADVAAPLAQSEEMAKRLRDMNVPVVECYEPGEPHVFDNKYTSPDVNGWDTYIQPILDFCNHHLSIKP
ncbi:alpha/beta-hydrolase [Thozetella sp. PMI_491]|nr:alpha/beta-hydrolase [Thozetella sp. PMI_491]